MKKFYLLLIAICVFMFAAEKTNAQTIAVHITPLDSVVKTCANNKYTATFNLGTGTHRININAFLDNNASFQCATDTVHGIYIDSVKITGVGDTLWNDSMNFATGTWSGDIRTNNTSCTLTYIIHLDCSMIPSSPFGHSYTLDQIWTDSLTTTSYNINSSNNNTFINYDVIFPFIVNLSGLTLPHYAGYLETLNLPFSYINTGLANADMVFNFTPDNSLYCNSIDTLGLTYRIGVSGSPTVLHPGSNVHILLPHDSTLYITQRIHVKDCLPSCTTAHADFRWHCFNSDTIINPLFCNQCQSDFDTQYTLGNKLDSGLFIQRVTPVSGTNLSCANNINNLVNYEYNIVNNSDAAMDSALFDLSTQTGIPFLTLIPLSSIHITNKCITCHIDTIVTSVSTTSACSSIVSQPVNELKILARDFARRDTINVRFSTFRCVEDDSVLSNNIKYYEHLSFGGSIIANKCHVQNPNSGLKYPLGQKYGGDGMTGAYGSDVDYKVSFTPTLADLSSQSNGFGDSAAFEVEMHGFDYNILDNELFGVVNTGDPMKGYLRVTVDCDIGLRVQYPMSDAYFKYDSAGAIKYLYPLYFNCTKNDSNLCVAGKYYFYFNLSNPAIKTILQKGFFEYELQACCGGQNGKRYYNVNFHVQLNPSGSCDTLNFSTSNPHWITPPACTLIGNGSGCNAWLPLAGKGGGITIHCPGCVTPGMIISSYKMQRTSFGLQDSNNDGKADDGLIPINKDSTWFTTYGSSLRVHFSGLGDKLEDKLVSHFQAGDAGSGGYTYVQMLSDSVQLPYLQLARLIPFGIDTMKVMPDSFYVYIDKPVSSSPNCIDCNDFGVNVNGYRTQRVLKIKGNNLQKFLTTNGHPNYYLYTFESKDSLGNWVGNIHDQSDSAITYNDPIDTLKGFFEGQQYRIRTFYSTCGNFLSSAGQPQLDDVRVESDIRNCMWMSGTPKSDNAFDVDSLQPSDTTALHNDGYTITYDGIHKIVNSTFAANHIFNCENFDGIHYFFSNNVSNSDWQQGITSGTGCTKIISIIAASSIADNLQNVYPYEYRPSLLHPKQFTIVVPNHYRVDSAFIHITVPINGGDSASGLASIPLHTRTGTIIIPSDSLPVFHCLKQSNNVIGDTLLYYGSQYTNEYLKFYISPVSCDSTLFIDSSKTYTVNYGITNGSCIPTTTCNSSDTTLLMPGQFSSFHVQPHDSITFSYNQITAINHAFSFPITISNSAITINGLASSDAPYYFIALPDTLAMPYFTNWSYIDTVNNVVTVIPATGQIIKLDSLLTVNEIHSGWLCAEFRKCIPDTIPHIIMPFYVGWNCTGFPTTPFNPLSVCGAKKDSIFISNNLSHIIIFNQCYPAGNKYDLCSPFTITTCFKSSQYGNVYPNSFTLGSMPTGLLLQGVALTNKCDSATINSALVYNSVTHNYPITNANLLAVGDTNGILNIGKSICVSATYIATCGLNQFNSPSTKLTAISFCGDTLTTTDSVARVAAISLTKAGSNCDTCFTLTKTASPTVVIPGQPVTYTITISSQNKTVNNINITEYLPSGFQMTSIFPPSAPYYTLAASGTLTITIHGYFNNPISCDSNINTVRMIVLPTKDTLWANTCIAVVPPPCTNNAIVVVNGADSKTVFASGTVLNQKIYLNGLFYVDAALYLKNCTVIAAPGARIVHVAAEQLTLDSTIISGCDSMWKGIDMSTVSLVNKIYLKNHSAIYDAETAIKSGTYSRISCLNSSLEDNIRGIYCPDISSTGILYQINLKVDNSRFGQKSAQLKPAYQGQSFYGTTPYSGIELTDVRNAVIGDTGYLPNHFSNMNFGIKGFRSNIAVSNVTMDNIRGSSYHHLTSMAISNVGDTYVSVVSNLTVDSYKGNVSITNSDIGIYSKYSNLDAYNCTMNNVRSGIVTNLCKDRLHTYVGFCTIMGSKFGIDWYNNNGASQMLAESNIISVSDTLGSSTIGISIQETISGGGDGHYIIDGNNQVTNTGNGYCVLMRNVNSGYIAHNYIYQTGGVSANSKGISVEGCQKAAVNCNVLSADSTQLATTGIKVSLSNTTSLFCNHVNKSYTGFYFGGTCGGTTMRGNAMVNNYLGLYLNNVGNTGNAATGQQNQAGNMWVNYRGPIGALNANFGGEQFSIFRVNTYTGQKIGAIEYFPLLNPQNDSAHWFFKTSGTPFSCQNSTVCSNIITIATDLSYERAISTDSISSTIYNDETKYQSDEYLYAYLVDHPAITFTDFDFSNFFTQHQNDNIGNLYSIESDLAATGVYISNTINLIRTTDSLLAIYSDSLQNVDSYGFADVGAANERIYHSWKLLNGTRISLIATQRSVVAPQLVDAGTLNGVIIPNEIPEANRVAMNTISARYVYQDLDSAINDYDAIFAIANQCPYQGGRSVFQAIAMIHALNDTVEFDDDALCLVNGIFRQANNKNVTSIPQEIFVRPNPANEMVTISLLNKEEGICEIGIFNNLGIEVLKKQMDCKEAQTNLDVKNLPSGVYYIKVNNQSSWNFVQKLVITR